MAPILSCSCPLWVQKQTSGKVRMMSALPPKADIGTQSSDVCFVPKADMRTVARYDWGPFSSKGAKMSRPPLPPFTVESAAQKARMAEDAWNSRDPSRVALAYTMD